MDTATAQLDIDRFRKVLARARSTLHGGGGDPERDTARRMAEQMARAAGLSFEAAARMADGASTFDGTTDFRGKWAKWQADKRARDAEAARHRFEETANERLLREATAPFDIMGRGADPHMIGRKALKAIKDALPWPGNVAAAVREVQAWDALEERRRVCWDKYRVGDAVMLRRGLVLKHALSSRATSVKDALARARWIMDHGAYSCLEDIDREIGRDTVFADFERMGERIGVLRPRFITG
ncbi:hypothetical protein MKL09_14430 [Methylobacterium sp. J-048]|uniref:hypothetical protein n=1 Tax=Methylobacterium sp. J-048 TaxID=2836635 RepID=UPI001FBA147C|nr:hypothetical protein [Methylobacterium sp. J-048]MCJ2057748.1 hypothetical protein [Methylobacterium sp. J-048]